MNNVRINLNRVYLKNLKKKRKINIFNKLKFITNTKNEISQDVNLSKNKNNQSKNKNFIKENISNVSKLSNNFSYIKFNLNKTNNICTSKYNKKNLIKNKIFNNTKPNDSTNKSNNIKKIKVDNNILKSNVEKSYEKIEKNSLFSKFFVDSIMNKMIKKENNQMNILQKKYSLNNFFLSKNSNASNSSLNKSKIKEKKQNIKKKEFKEINIIIKSKNHSVILVENIQNKTQYILKKFPKKLNNNYSKILLIKNEANMLKRLDHPGIVKIYKFIEGKKSFKIYLEKAKGMNLTEFLETKHFKIYDTFFVKWIMKQLFNIIKYLHELNISHHDIKLDNMIYDYETKKITLIDFGFSMRYAGNKLILRNGTPYYISPEHIKNFKINPIKSDIWACGIVYHKIYCNKFPFRGENEKELYNNIRNNKYKPMKYFDKDSKIILRQILNKNEDERITINQILNYNFFN